MPSSRMPNAVRLEFAPGALHGKQVAGFKLWANFGRGTGVHKGSPGYDYLYSMETGELLAIIHAYLIGKYRTSAQSAIAVKYLSPPDAASIGLYSAGRIAEGQLEAVCRVRPIRTVRVYSRTPKDRVAFCERMSKRLDVEVIPANAPDEVPRDAESWYVNVGRPAATYCAEIGLRTPSGRFLPLLRSNAATTPRATPAADREVRWLEFGRTGPAWSADQRPARTETPEPTSDELLAPVR